MTPSSDNVREYVRGERRKRRISQKEMAKGVGLSLRAYTEWEKGRTRTIKDRVLRAALAYLHTPQDIIARLLGSKDTVGGLVEDINSLPAQEREERRKQVEQLTDELLADPKKLDQWIGYGERLKEED